ncbi:hypothetical protein Glove_276g56 [Diversispora epigaea]|uniref:Uncharacterized protein n=1 Tax=Diversispora epigaea TaxID=1348612 RepID=A0A397I4A4_9GLOM|nr:hypothetical protein Glove_276g56 [Diversispora epigaea]
MLEELHNELPKYYEDYYENKNENKISNTTTKTPLNFETHSQLRCHWKLNIWELKAHRGHGLGRERSSQFSSPRHGNPRPGRFYAGVNLPVNRAAELKETVDKIRLYYKFPKFPRIWISENYEGKKALQD